MQKGLVAKPIENDTVTGNVLVESGTALENDVVQGVMLGVYVAFVCQIETSEALDGLVVQLPEFQM